MEKPPKRIDLTHLSQNPVETAEGDTLGEVTELVANAEEGRIEYVKLRIRSQPNVGSLTVTVPWSQFELGGFGDCLQLDISRSVLESVASRSEPRHRAGTDIEVQKIDIMIGFSAVHPKR